MRAAGPVVDPVPCSACGKLIDPLRAGQVAIFDLRFHYFCNSRCRLTFVGEPQLPPLHPRALLRGDEPRLPPEPRLTEPLLVPPPARAPMPATLLDEPARERALGLDERPPPARADAAARPELDAPIVDAFPPVSLDQALPEPPAIDDDRALLEPYANVRAYLDRCLARPAWKRTVAAYDERVKAG